jgi:oxygen-independent coproporphyrinogen-3 oxidase
MPSCSVYVHIPFCRHLCSYCDFNTYAGLDALIPAYIQALTREIKRLARPLPAHSIYFGGGTPSLLPSWGLEQVLAALGDAFPLASSVEVTLEANLEGLSLSYLRDLRRLGVNRLSLGMQSAHPGELRILERRHDYAHVVEVVKLARQAGFDNLSLDLIFGLPEQPLDLWARSLDLALRLAPEHFCLYGLTIEPGTPLGKMAQRGLVPLPDPDLAARMYEHADDVFKTAGYLQYEITSWAKSISSSTVPPQANPHFACRHNLQYWFNKPFLGLGAGASGFVDRVRTVNVASPQAYIHSLSAQDAPGKPFPQTAATASAVVVSREDEMRETMLMGLRLTRAGVSDTAFKTRFNVSMHDAFATEIDDLISLGLLEQVGQVVRLTPRGRLLGDQVFVRFV